MIAPTSELGGRGSAAHMPERREFECKSKTYTLTLYDDGVVGIYDSAGKLFLGWPETVILEPATVMQKSDEEICQKLSELRRL